jgi:16S rRNA (uracil1498-N3)-methyltransferase
VEKITLGHQYQSRPLGQCFQRLLNALEQFHRMGVERLASVKDVADHRRRHRIAAKLQRGFDHRQSESLGAVAEQLEIADFARLERAPCDPGVGERLEHAHQRVLRFVEKAHVVPQRIVGIEADEVDRHGTRTNKIRHSRESGSLAQTKKNLGSRFRGNDEIELVRYCHPMPATPAWPPKSLPRLYVKTPLGAGATVELDAAQANYLGNVMRLKPGDPLLVFDGMSGEWLAEVAESGRRWMTLSVGKATRPQERVPDLWLAFAPVKKGRVDWLVEKAVELGVARLLPVVTQRTIVDKLNLDRMRAHIVEAAEQCGRTSLADIEEPVRLDGFLKARDPKRTLYFADESGGASAATAFAPGPALILTGPEGGFTPDEAAAIHSAPNSTAISLGPRILRAETAALAAVASWMASVGDWR